MEYAMLKQTAIYLTLIVSFFVSPALASGGVEYTEEDEAKAFASRYTISGAEYGTATEAKAMLDRAATAVKANATAAIAAFNRNDSQFRDRDLFVFCFNTEDGKFTAHEALVGQNVRTIHDKTGKPLGEQIYQRAKEGQVNTVAYMASVPGSTEQASKRAYVTRVGDQVCGVSFYRFNGPGTQPTE
jgi:signal transduction histidine kinase